MTAAVRGTCWLTDDTSCLNVGLGHNSWSSQMSFPFISLHSFHSTPIGLDSDESCMTENKWNRPSNLFILIDVETSVKPNKGSTVSNSVVLLINVNQS